MNSIIAFVFFRNFFLNIFLTTIGFMEKIKEFMDFTKKDEKKKNSQKKLNGKYKF